MNCNSNTLNMAGSFRTINNKNSVLMKVPWGLFILTTHHPFSIHKGSIQSLVIKIDKFLNGSSPSFLNNMFHGNTLNHLFFEIGKNFTTKSLPQFVMKLKTYLRWHPKFGLKFFKLSKWAHLWNSLDQK